MWSDQERIGLADNHTQLVWSQNPGKDEELRVVWCNLVGRYLEGELANGTDDNGNELIDEQGLSFSLQGDQVSIRLTLERQGPDGSFVQKTVETTVTCRN